ncbi:MFS transporter [Actinoplanes sp. TBRC 11911]|uniref:MFS transporter n=1 Tax=Actinoplanes sp. TBRC 11911 TaxID=2729386 RepID=UPI00145C9B6E|nr:MFS transporter [Actinoplanes sp. TBRC 11911]NMO57880.1 MFS transporter [Actinoplanes sp. TBRC 11911]
MTKDRRSAALLVLCAGMLMIILDVTIVNVALPSIQRDLGFSQSGLAWVVNAYLIPFGSLLLLAGRIGDLVSRRGMFVGGLILFTAASIVCGLATSQQMLIAARFLQGIGGAMTSAVVLGMIVTMFPEAREQARAIGVYSFVASAGGAVGLLLGGVLTEAISWHWIFFVNLPVGIATAVAALRLLPADKGAGLRQGADVAGGLLITSSLVVAVYTVVAGGAAVRTLGLAILAVALLAAFVVREATAATPLIPLRIFRSRTLTGANVAQLLSAAGMFGMFFVGVLYAQHVLGYDALRIGLAFLPVTVFMGGLSLRYSERLISRYGARTTVVTGLALVAAGLFWFARVPVDGRYLTDVLPSMVVLGIGAGMAFPALAALGMADATPQDAGLASGVFNTTAEVGSALGLAVLATLSAGRYAGLRSTGVPEMTAQTGGYRLAFVAAGLLVVAALIVTVVVVRVRTSPEATELGESTLTAAARS